MQIKTAIKLLAFNGALSIMNILFFSEAFLGISISGRHPFFAALGVTVIVISIILFFYINYIILKPTQTEAPAPAAKEKEIQTLDDCMAAVGEYISNNIKTFRNHLNLILSHIQRMKKKRQNIEDVLSERFDENELSYKKFLGAVINIEEIMILNIKSLLNRINVFDEEEYEKLLHDQYSKKSPASDRSEQILNSRLEIFYECKEFVQNAVDNNEEMLIRLDKLLIEISKLNSLDGEDIDQLNAMKEIDDLIHNTKWYR